MRFSKFSLLYLVAMIGISATSLPALANTSEKPRPKIGLVLGGGGARAGAHVGVLELLEQMHIPIDFVVGTSMGSFVGALYASGLSANQIKTILDDADWPTIFGTTRDRRDVPFRRKAFDFDFLIKYRLGFRNGDFSIPEGLVLSQHLNLLLKNNTLPTKDVSSFDDLPTPFRAVAVDIEKGEEVVLDAGDLSGAVIASMTIPGLFPPVARDGRLLVDGGLLNNLPISVALEQQLDVLIVVDVGTLYRNRDQLRSIFQTVDQMTLLLSRGNSNSAVKNLRKQDIFIRPELKKIATADYDRIKQTYEFGRIAAEPFRTKLEPLALTPEKYQEYLDRRQRHMKQSLTVDKLEVQTDSAISPKIIRRHIDFNPNNTLDVARLNKDLEHIYNLDFFSNVDYQIRTENDQTTLKVEATQNRPLKNFFRFGLNLESNFSGNSDFTLSTSFAMTQINRLAGEWYNELRLGEENSLFTEFYQPLDYGLRWFIAPSFRIGTNNTKLFVGNDVIQENYLSGLTLSLAVGRTFNTWGELRAGASRSWLGSDPLIGVATASDQVDDFRLFSQFRVDQVDNVHFPHNGYFMNATWQHLNEALGGEFDAQLLDTVLFGAKTFNKTSIGARSMIATTLDGNNPTQEFFNLGGLFSLSGLQKSQLSGRHLGHLMLLLYQRIYGNGTTLLDNPVYLGVSAEVGNVWQGADEIGLDNVIVAGSTFVGFDSVLGPLFLAWGITDSADNSFYFFFGDTF